MEPTPKKSWWSKNWKWFVPTGCLTIVVVGVLVIFGIITLVFSAIKSSDVYKLAVAKAKANPTVISELGEPIEPAWLVSGSINVSGSTGTADLSIPISGPKKSGTVYAVARKSAGEWQFTTLQVEVEGRLERIDLGPPRYLPGSTAPR
ncbi:MAG TPA: cytochrome c oxidase assembly factor Coa1 family protein [Blastocatellia bacterium]|nr:cytochrome c oxidase assembly factor Coa1 family protein [Blastocatellia bacterium]